MAEEQGSLSILAIGAGAIGSYLGGSLALQGHRLAFIERAHNAPTLEKGGLLLTLGEDQHQLKNFAVFTSTEEALDASSYDVALFALKSYDTAAALEDLRPFADRMPPLLCLQNGVDNEPVLAEVVDEDGVIAGTVTSAVGKSGPGQVVLERKRGVGLSNRHPLASRLQAAMQAADLNPQLYANPAEMKWSKLLTNLLTNASAAILNMTPAQIFEDKRLFRLEMLQLREALAVMRALGLRVVDLPGIPVRALAFAAGNLNFALARPLMKRAVGSGRGGKMPSLHIDLHSGRERSEVGWLNGAVVRHGEQLGVDTPINRLLFETLASLIEGQAPKSLSLDELLSRLDA